MIYFDLSLSPATFSSLFTSQRRRPKCRISVSKIGRGQSVEASIALIMAAI
jgi:hypothetical protein